LLNYHTFFAIATQILTRAFRRYNYYMNKKYLGVSYHPRDKIHAPRVKFMGKVVWLKTFKSAEAAARVRDIAERWLHAGNARLNFKERILPQGLSEPSVARWMYEGGMPVKVMVHRIPLPILIEAGITTYELAGAGVALDKIAAAAQLVKSPA